MQRAFQTIEQTVVKAERARVQASVKGDREKERAMARVARQAEKWAREEARAVEKAEKEKVRAAQQADRARIKSEQDAAKEKIRAGKLAAAEQDKILLRQQRMEERIQRDLVRFRERAERDKTRALERWSRQREQIQTRSALMAGRMASREAREEVAARNRFARTVGTTVGGTVSRLGNAAVGLAGTALTLGGGFTIADAVRTEARDRGRAADLALASGGGKSAKELKERASAVGIQFGMSTENVLEGLDQFVAKSGDVKAGFDALSDLVELATATGADLGELSRTAGIVQVSTGDSKATMGVMREMAGMGRAGSVDMRELAEYASRITSGATKFSDKRSAMTALGAIVQQSAATGGSTGAAEATEAITSLGADIYKNEKDFSAIGMKVRDKSGKFLKDPMEIIKESIVRTGGDEKKLQGLFGLRSIRAVSGYADVFKRASEDAKAHGATAAGARTAGLEAMDAAFKKFAKAALDEEQVKKEAAARAAEADKQYESALTALREAVGTQLVPELTKLIPVVKELIPQIANMTRKGIEFVKWLTDNPVKGIGAIVLGAIAKDLAVAGIGAGVRVALTSLINGAMAAGGVTTPVGGAAAAGTAAAGVGAALSIGSAVQVGSATYGAIDDTNQELRGDISEAGAISKRLRTGRLTPAQQAEERAKAAQKMMQIQAKMAEAQKIDSGAVASFSRGVGATAEGIANVFGYSGTSQHDAVKAGTRAEITKQNEQALTIAYQQLAKALAENTAAQRSSGAADPHSPQRNANMALRGGSNN